MSREIVGEREGDRNRFNGLKLWREPKGKRSRGSRWSGVTSRDLHSPRVISARLIALSPWPLGRVLNRPSRIFLHEITPQVPRKGFHSRSSPPIISFRGSGGCGMSPGRINSKLRQRIHTTTCAHPSRRIFPDSSTPAVHRHMSWREAPQGVKTSRPF